MQQKENNSKKLKKQSQQDVEDDYSMTDQSFEIIFNPKNERDLDLATKQLIYIAVNQAKRVFQEQFEQQMKDSVKQGDILVRIIDFYDNMRRINLNEGFMVMLLCLLDFFETDSEINQNMALKNWKKVPFAMLKNFLGYFSVNQKIDVKEIGNHITNLIFSSKFQEAVGVFKVFPHVKQYLDIRELITRMVTQANLNEAEAFVHDDLELKKFFVKILAEKLYNEKAVFYVNKFDLDHREFPILQERFMKAKLEKLVKTKFQTPDKIEEIISYSSEMLAYLADTMYQFGQQDQAISILLRHKLEQDKQLLSHCKANLLKKLEKKDFQYTINPILEKDGFGPTQEVCLNNINEGYINLNQGEEFNITEERVHFIDSINETFSKAKEQLLQNGQIVGFDTEFEPTVTNFAEAGVAILQLATETDVFIFDVISLKKETEFVSFIVKLFQNKEIIKIGHSISQDFAKIDKDFGADVEIIPEEMGWVDIANFYKDVMKRRQIEALGTIASSIIGGKLDKTEQISNWIKRPLRKAQLHYAALDSFICIVIYKKLMKKVEMGQKGIQEIDDAAEKEKKNKKKKKEGEKMITVDNFFSGSEKYLSFWEPAENVKFLVDNMLFKLVKYLRNVGIDTAYIKHSDKNLLVDLSLQEKRIVVTRDQKFFFSKKRTVPTYYFGDQSLKTEGQFKDLMNFFKISDREEFLLSRCVHCNSSNLQVSDAETVKKYIYFKHDDDYKNYEFWLCLDCKQVYWEGATFQKSKQRFKELTENLGTQMEDLLIDKLIVQDINKENCQLLPLCESQENIKFESDLIIMASGIINNEFYSLYFSQRAQEIYLYQAKSNNLVSKLAIQEVGCEILDLQFVPSLSVAICLFEKGRVQLINIEKNMQLVKSEVEIQLPFEVNEDKNNDIQYKDIQQESKNTLKRKTIHVIDSENSDFTQLYFVYSQDFYSVKLNKKQKNLYDVQSLKLAKYDNVISHFCAGEQYIFVGLNMKKIDVYLTKNMHFIQQFNPLFQQVPMIQLIYMNPYISQKNHKNTQLIIALSAEGQIKVCEWSQKLVQYNSIQDIYLNNKEYLQGQKDTNVQENTIEQNAEQELQNGEEEDKEDNTIQLNKKISSNHKEKKLSKQKFNLFSYKLQVSEDFSQIYVLSPELFHILHRNVQYFAKNKEENKKYLEKAIQIQRNVSLKTQQLQMQLSISKCDDSLYGSGNIFDNQGREMFFKIATKKL